MKNIYRKNRFLNVFFSNSYALTAENTRRIIFCVEHCEKEILPFFSGIVFHLSLETRNIENESKLEELCKYFSEKSQLYISISFTIEALTPGVCSLLKSHKVFWSLRENLAALTGEKLGLYLSVKNTTDINNRGVDISYNDTSLSYTEAFDFVYQYSYGYPVSLFFENDNLGKLLDDYAEFLKLILNKIKNVDIGMPEAFFTGKSLPSIIMRNLLSMENGAYRLSGFSFSPFVEEDGYVYFSSDLIGESYVIGKIGEAFDFEKIKKLEEAHFDNSHICPECPVNRICPEMQKCSGKQNFYESIAALCTGFLDKARVANADVLEYLKERQSAY